MKSIAVSGVCGRRPGKSSSALLGFMASDIMPWELYVCAVLGYRKTLFLTRRRTVSPVAYHGLHGPSISCPLPLELEVLSDRKTTQPFAHPIENLTIQLFRNIVWRIAPILRRIVNVPVLEFRSTDSRKCSDAFDPSDFEQCIQPNQRWSLCPCLDPIRTPYTRFLDRFRTPVAGMSRVNE
jgi:hypothetical protein